MLEEKTRIDRAKLEKWASILPECREFLINFFISSKHSDHLSNYLNYFNDIAKYSKTKREVKNNARLLAKAYEEIVGIIPSRN